MLALWDQLVDCICRPPRDDYAPEEIVGGTRGLFRVASFEGRREDVMLTNRRGMKLQCSHFIPKHVRGRDGKLPCVIYCHCNSGSRRDAEEAICILIPQGVSVFTLDFAGSGRSEGQWVTLGAEEQFDVEAAVAHLRGSGKVSTLGLWGRSMGAVTALLYSQRDPSIAGMVLDSPFSRLTDLMLEIVEEQKMRVPRPIARMALGVMRRSVMRRAGFDINKVAPLESVGQSFIPALFGHATGDTFIKIGHSEALHAAYSGDKNLIKFEGDHNSRRPEFFYNSVAIFLHNTLQLEDMLEGGGTGLNAELLAEMQHEASSNSASHRPWAPPGIGSAAAAAARAGGGAGPLSSGSTAAAAAAAAADRSHDGSRGAMFRRMAGMPLGGSSDGVGGQQSDPLQLLAVAADGDGATAALDGRLSQQLPLGAAAGHSDDDNMSPYDYDYDDDEQLRAVLELSLLEAQAAAEAAAAAARGGGGGANGGGSRAAHAGSSGNASPLAATSSASQPPWPHDAAVAARAATAATSAPHSAASGDASPSARGGQPMGQPTSATFLTSAINPAMMTEEEMLELTLRISLEEAQPVAPQAPAQSRPTGDDGQHTGSQGAIGISQPTQPNNGQKRQAQAPSTTTNLIDL